MKKIFCTVGLICGVMFFNAQNLNIVEAEPGVEYGAGVSEDITYDVYSTERLIKALEKDEEIKNIVIQGTVTAVCEKKGCWISLKNNENKRIFVKMKNYAFFLPQNIVGKTVLLHADAKLKTTSVEELRHYAEDAKKSKEEINAITEPLVEIRILAKGIKVVS